MPPNFSVSFFLSFNIFFNKINLSFTLKCRIFVAEIKKDGYTILPDGTVVKDTEEY